MICDTILCGATAAPMLAPVRNEWSVMNRSFLSLLATVLLGTLAAMAPLPDHAAEVRDRGYARVDVPDMSQALRFFSEVLGCEPLDSRADGGRSGSSLLLCGQGFVVELAASPAHADPDKPGTGTPIQLVSDDLPGAARSLRHEVSNIGQPRTLRSGQTAVDFVTPWGLHMELVSRQADARVAGS